MNINLVENLNTIISTLLNKGMKKTQIANDMGYTTTTQLNSILNGESLISTKAIIALIENLNVNPLFLFKKRGEIFLTDEELEIERLKVENRKYLQMHDEAVKTVFELNEMVKKLEKRNEDLIEMSIKFMKGQNSEEDKSENK